MQNMNSKSSAINRNTSSPKSSAEVNRRDFLKYTGLGTAALTFAPWNAMAGPFMDQEFSKLVPPDKKLSPAWVKSLFDRGERTRYKGVELEKIGMPIGGICAGQLYLGGDGKLWHWDIFNHPYRTGSEHYAKPMTATSPLAQGFALQVTAGGKKQTLALDRTGFANITFNGEYPIGYVEYQDPECPVTVSLEAFSPFIPLNTADSALPATVMQYTVKNTAAESVQIKIAGWLENAVCLHTGKAGMGVRHNRIARLKNMRFLECSLEAKALPQNSEPRSDIVFEDFEKETYEGWVATGTAFGNGPIAKSKVPAYQKDLGMKGNWAVNSHSTATGEGVGSRDNATGTLTSKSFVIERHYISFLIGGGSHQGKTCLNLLVDGKVVASATGNNDNKMSRKIFEVRAWSGKTAQLQIVDEQQGSWGNIGIDDIVFTDRAPGPQQPLDVEYDYGTMGLALLDNQPGDFGLTNISNEINAENILSTQADDQPAAKPIGEKLCGALGRTLQLEGGKSTTVTFLVAWYFPKLLISKLPETNGRHYGQRFANALEVAEYTARNLGSFQKQTRLWHDTWYDSTLPYWFLDRTFLNASILASATCNWFASGRFYGWEGVGCCPGTCTHVWQYAHSVARLFPDLERDTRTRVDFGIALQPDGSMKFRAEHNKGPAVDGQTGTILRAYREHQMCADASWLKANWPKIRQTIEWLIAQDKDGNGILEGAQHNTLDADWYGPVAWLSGMYLAALRAGEEMANEIGDREFALLCRKIFAAGQQNLVAKLFEGEYFINRPDTNHAASINSGTGCHIDQALGQSWAFQVGLGRVMPEKETRQALKSLWKYNFTPDIGPYRETNKAGRWYAMPGEGGLLMCTFPRTDWDFKRAAGNNSKPGFAGYFNECMNGFEYQVAGHMIWEDLVMEGLAITRMLHDRHHPLRRNPFNEIECGDHYARSMASHGIYLAACGYEYHGPKGYLAFAPRLTPEKFQCAFTAAQGWGTFAQQRKEGAQHASLEIKWGQLVFRTLALETKTGRETTVKAMLNGQEISAKQVSQGKRIMVQFQASVRLDPGQKLEVILS